MSKYYKVDDVQELITACMWRMTLAKERNGEGFVEYDKQIIDVDELRKRLSKLLTIEVSEYPQEDGITPTVITTEVSEDMDYCNNCPYISYNGDCISKERIE